MRVSRTLITVLLVFPSFCCSPSSDSSRADVSLPSNFKIEVAEGGGFTGMWSGYSILPGDSILEWNGRPGEMHTTYAGRLPHDTTIALLHEVKAGHLLDVRPNVVPGNYTHTLSIALDGSAHEFGWASGVEADNVSPVVVNFRSRCLSAIHKALGR